MELQLLPVEVREGPVLRKRCDPEIDRPVIRGIGMPLLNQLRNHRDLLWNVLHRTRLDMRGRKGMMQQIMRS